VGHVGRELALTLGGSACDEERTAALEALLGVWCCLQEPTEAPIEGRGPAEALQSLLPRDLLEDVFGEDLPADPEP